MSTGMLTGTMTGQGPVERVRGVVLTQVGSDASTLDGPNT
jgi:hypothetical protein